MYRGLISQFHLLFRNRLSMSDSSEAHWNRSPVDYVLLSHNRPRPAPIPDPTATTYPEDPMQKKRELRAALPEPGETLRNVLGTVGGICMPFPPGGRADYTNLFHMQLID